MKHIKIDDILTEIEGVEFERFQFNGGEEHVKIKEDLRCEIILIEARLDSSSKIMQLLLMTDALRREGVLDINLLIPYVPYARQDRVMVKGEPLSIKVLCDLINQCNFHKVYTLDNHSSVTDALLNNCIPIDITEILSTFFSKNTEKSVLIAPDSGSVKKTFKIAQEFGFNKIITCDKIRNLKTGQIVKTEVYCDDLKGTDCFIVDDICDGGRTFIEIAKILKTKNCGKIHLFVSHGIFSQGSKVFEGLIDHIATTNSVYVPRQDEKIEVFELIKEDLPLCP